MGKIEGSWEVEGAGEVAKGCVEKVDSCGGVASAVAEVEGTR